MLYPLGRQFAKSASARIAAAKHQRRRRQLLRALSVEPLETRRLLAANVLISNLDNGLYDRVEDTVAGTVTYTPNAADAQIPVTSLRSDFLAGLSVLVDSSTTAAAQPGDVTFADLLLMNSVGVADLTIRAERDILIDNDIVAIGSGTGLNLTLNADRDANSDGRVVLNPGVVVDVGEGNATIGGGTNPSTMPAVGRAGSPQGVVINQAILSAISGNIVINGRGGNVNDSVATGVLVLGIPGSSGSSGIFNDTGTLTINGTAGVGSGSDNDGIRFSDEALISTLEGAVTLVGNASSGSDSNDGIELSNGSVIVSSGMGPAVLPVSITGTSSDSTGGTSRGVAIDNSSVVTSSAMLSISGNSSSSSGQNLNHGVQIFNASNVGTIPAQGLPNPAPGLVSISGSSNNPAATSKGVSISGMGTIVATEGGMIVISGDTLSGTAIDSDGVYVFDGASVTGRTPTSTGDISISGTAAGNAVSGFGVEIDTSGILGGFGIAVLLSGTSSDAGGVGINTLVTGTSLTIDGSSTGPVAAGVQVVGPLTATSMSVSGSSTTGPGVAIFNGGSLDSSTTATLTSTGQLLLENATITTVDLLTLQAIDTPSATDDVVVNDSSISSSNGDIVFDVGDHISINDASSLIANNLTINLDLATVDPDPGSSSVSFANLAGTYSVSGNIGLFGGIDDNVVNAIPGVTMSFDGGSTTDFDTLVVDGSGGEVVVTATAVTIAGTGTVTNITNVEAIRIINASNVRILGDSSDNTFTIDGDSASSNAGIATSGGPLVIVDTMSTTTVVEGAEGDDTFILDVTAGLKPGITLQGGANNSTAPGDQIQILTQTSGTFNTLEFNYLNENDGSIAVDGVSVDYVEMEPITSTIVALDVTLNYSAAGESISVTQSGNDITVDSSSGEITTFDAPTANLTINTGSGTDSVTIDGLNVTVSGTVSIGDFADTISFVNNSTNVVTGGLSVLASLTQVAANLQVDGNVIIGDFVVPTNVEISGSIITGGNLSIGSDITLTGTTALTALSGRVTLADINGAQTLVVNAGTGIQIFGDVDNIESIDASTANGSIRIQNVSTFGSQTYNSPVIAGAAGGMNAVDLVSSAGRIEFSSTLDDDLTIRTVLNITSDSETTFGGTVGGLVPFDSLVVSASGPVQLSHNFTVANSLSFTTLDSGTDNLTLQTGVTLATAATGSVSLNVLDDLDLQVGAFINSGSLDIVVDDPLIADDSGVGSNINVDATLNVTGATTIVGGLDTDTFNVTPQTAATLSLDGGAPTTPDGDLVQIDGGGQDVMLDFTSGGLSVGSNPPISIASIERLALSNIGALGVVGTDGDDTMTLTDDAVSGILSLSFSGGVTVNIDSSVTTTLIDGASGDDTFVLDVSAGLRSGITLQGGANSSASPGDQIRIVGSPAMPIGSLVFNYSNLNDGSIVIDGNSIDYLGMEPITSTVAADDIALNYSSVGESITITQSGTDIVIDSSAGEITTFVVPTVNLTIDTGGGLDTVTIDGLDVTLSGFFAVDDPDLATDDTVTFVNNTTIAIGSLDLSVPQIGIDANLSVDGELRLGDGVGTGQIRIGATVSSNADLVFNEPVLLSGPTVVTSTAVISFKFPIQGTQSLDVTGGTLVEFLQDNGDVTPLASLSVTATSGSIRLDDVTSTGAQTFNSPVVTGAGGGTVNIVGGPITFASTIDNGSTMVDDLQIDSSSTVLLQGGIGQSIQINTLDVTSRAPLTIDQSISVSGSALFFVPDAAGSSDTLTIASSAFISATGAITLQAGDAVDVQANSQLIANMIGIVVDSISVPPVDSEGGVINVAGTLTSPLPTSINGSVDAADTISLRPQPGTSFFVFGDDPSLIPGDTLTLDASGAGITIDVGANMVSVNGSQSVTVAGIEVVALVNYSDLTVNGSVSAETFQIASTPTGDVLTIDNGSRFSLADSTNITVNGGAGDDQLVYDRTGGAISSSIVFNGGRQTGFGNGDSLVILGSFTTQTFNYTAAGVDGNNGSVDLDGTVVTYTGLEPIIGGSSVDTVLNFSTGVANNATLRNNSAAGSIEIVDNGATFEDTVFPNPTGSLTVNLGDIGDSLTIETLDAAYAAPLIIRGGTGTDSVQVNAVNISNTSARGLDISNFESVSIAGSTFSGNVLGGVRIVDAVTTIANSTFSGNNSNESGAGVSVTGSSLTISDSMFLNNTTLGTVSIPGKGGGLFYDGNGNGVFTISDTTFSGNKVDAGGGGAYIVDAGGTISGGSFSMNEVTGAGLTFDTGGGGLAILGDANVPVVLISNTVIESNTAPAAGGLAVVDALVTVDNSVIRQNTASAAQSGGGGIGGVANNAIASNLLTLNRSSILSNQAAGNGAGVGIINANISVDSTTFQGNQASSGRGGGLALLGLGSSGTATLRATTFHQNTAASQDGGAIAVQNMGIDLENVTISNNSAATLGGGISYTNNVGTVTKQIRFSTFADNSSTSAGSNLAATGSPIDVFASIFAGGSINAPAGVLRSLGSNLDSGNTGGFDQLTDFVNTDPLLGPLQDNGGLVFTHALLAGSRAIDAAGTTGPATDARGITRPFMPTSGAPARNDSGAFESSLSATVDVLITKTASANPIAGGIVTYTIVVTNTNGPGDARGVTVTDTLDPQLTFGALNAGTSGVTNATVGTAPRNLIFNVGTLPVGATRTFSYTASIATSATGVIPNTAVITTTDIDTDAANNMDDEPITVGQNFDLVIDKSVNLATAVPGQAAPLIYRIVVGHAAGSISDAANVTVRDLVPEGLSGVVITALTATGTPTFDTTTREAVIDFSTIPVGETRTITITANIDAPATGSIVNPATVSAPGETVTTNNSDNAITTLTPDFDVTVTKSTTSTNVAPSDTVTYTVGVSKSGPSQANSIFFSDLVPAGLTFVSGMLNGVAVTNNNGILTVPEFNLSDNAPVVGLLVFTVNADASGAISNTATVTAAGESNINNNTASAQVNVMALTASLAGRVYVDRNRNDVFDSGDIGSAGITVQLTGTDTGGTPVNLTLTSGADGSYSFTNLAAGTYRVQRVDTPANLVSGSEQIGTGAFGTVVSDIENAFTQVTLGAGANAANFSFALTEPVAHGSVDVSLTRTGNITTTSAGGFLFLEFILSNESTVDATDVVATFPLDPNLTFDSGLILSGSVRLENDQIVVRVPSLAAGRSDSVALSLRVNANVPGGTLLSTTGSISSTSADPVPGNNTATAVNTVLGSRVLTSGSGDGSVQLTVNALGAIGTQPLSGRSDYDPIGPIGPAETIFTSALLVGRSGASQRSVLTSGSFFASTGNVNLPDLTLIEEINGDQTRVTSAFSLGSLRFDLVQELVSMTNSNGMVIGSRLEQTYTVTNLDSTPAAFDLVRFLDGDLEFDGSITDGGGVLRSVTGEVVLFETESSVFPNSDTTFVGIASNGGIVEPTNHFQVDQFSNLGRQVVNRGTLVGSVAGDGDIDGLVDSGNEYDVSLALRNVFNLAAGANANYTTTTFFGSGPISNVVEQPASISGHLYCDANGNHSEDAGELISAATIYLDENGNRIHDPSERSTLSDSLGNYRFDNVVNGSATVAVIVPPTCNTIPEKIGTVRTSIDVGNLARSIATADDDGDGDNDLYVVSELDNVLAVLRNDGGTFVLDRKITLGDRPQAVSVWNPNSSSTSSSPTIAVAAIGTPSNRGNVFVVHDNVQSSFKAGDGPIDIVVDDFNGDQVADIISVGFRSGELSLTLGGTNQSRVVADARNVRSIVTGDFNGDSQVDIAVAGLGFLGDTSSQLKLLLGNGDGTFSLVANVSPDRDVVDLVADDVDGDGRQDLIVLAASGNLIVYRLGISSSSNSDNTLSVISELNVPGGGSSIASGDFNGDGETDVAIANLGDQTIQLLVGIGDGTFELVSTITNVTAPSGLVVADFDGDGVGEIAVANFYHQQPEFPISGSPIQRLPSTVTLLKVNVAEQSLVVSSNSTSTVNIAFPTADPQVLLDVNRDAAITAGDALAIISAMRLAELQSASGEAEQTEKSVVRRASSRAATDVNGDGQTTALDALMIINHLNLQQFSPQLLAGESSLDDDDDDRLAALDSIFASGLF